VDDLDAPGSGVQLAVHRTAKEARTDTLKHARTDSTAAVTAAAHADRGVSARQGRRAGSRGHPFRRDISHARSAAA
jgi:hypothetical protein